VLAALTAAGDREQEPHKRTRLRRAAEGVGGRGKDLLVEVMASVITKSSGLG
jgi:hypothetical protein